MIEVVSIFDDVSKDTAVIEQNGTLTIPMFNRFSRRAELRLIDWLSGDPAGNLPPEPWATQKNKDYLSPFLEKFKTNTTDYIFARPSNYYRFEDLKRIGARVDSSCDEEEDDEEIKPDEKKYISITLLDASQFNNRVNTYIEEDKPTLKNPIAKLSGKEFETYPDVGPLILEYIRYPEFASIKAEKDDVFNDEKAVSVSDYEWDEWAREPLIWFITDFFANRLSNKSMKEFNIATKKTVRE